jgi:hypothetical protein
MNAITKLKKLPEEKQVTIDKEFGCAEVLYRKVFNLYSEDYSLFQMQSPGYKQRADEIKSELGVIEDKLNLMGINGTMFLKNISNDHEENMISKAVNDLNAYMRHRDTNNVSLRVWLEKNF